MVTKVKRLAVVRLMVLAKKTSLGVRKRMPENREKRVRALRINLAAAAATTTTAEKGETMGRKYAQYCILFPKSRHICHKTTLHCLKQI